MSAADQSYLNGDYHYDMGFYEMQSRATAQRVRKCMFPDFSFDESLINEEYNVHSVLNSFMEPSCSVQKAVIDLLNVPDQSKEMEHQVNSLIPLLASSDPTRSAAAAREVYLMSKSDAISAYLAGNERLIGALISASRSNDLLTQRNTWAALSHLAGHNEGRLHIFRSGGIAELIRMLGSHDESVRRYAVTTLHNLLLYLEPAKEDIIALGGLEALVPLLAEENPKLQAMTADSLYLILLDRPRCKQSFLSCNGPSYLVSILSSRSGYLKLLYAIARCVRSVSTDQNNKMALVSMGCLEAMHQNLLQIEDPKRRLTFLNAIRNLSDAATNLDSLSPLVRDLLVILKDLKTDEEITSCACGILSNLTCNNVRNKQTVCENNGIAILVQVAGRFSNIEDITEPALCTLRHCTVRHPLANQAQTDVRLTRHGYQILLSLLATRRPPIVKAALGVARNCAIQQLNLNSLLAESTQTGEQVLTIAIEVLEHSGSRLSEDFDGLTEGVSLLELVEAAVSVLHQLARDPGVAEFIYLNKPLMNILITLLSMEQINNNDDLLILREVLGLLYQLTKNAEGAKAVKLCGVVPLVVDAYNSPNNAIAAYATVILRNLGVDRPANVNYRHNSHSSTDTLGSNGRIVQQEYRGNYGWVNDGLEPELYNELFTTLGEMKHDHIETNQQGNSWFDTDL